MNVLILSGGGSRGAFQAGVYQKLRNEGWTFDAVAGVSVGALNAAMIATGQEDQLQTLWKNISQKQVLKKRGIMRSLFRFIKHKIGVQNATLGYYSNEPLQTLLRDNIGNIFTKDFYCGTVNMFNGMYKSHKALKGMVPWNYVEKVIASTAIPLVFDPVVIDGHLHTDGGVRHVSPISSFLKEYEPENIVVITCNKYKNPAPISGGNPKDMIDVAKIILEVALNEIFIKDLREFERINHLVRQAQAQGVVLENSRGNAYKEYKAKLYQPHKSLGDSLNFTAKQAKKNIEIGLEADYISL